MLRRWLRSLRPGRARGQLETIWLADRAGAPMYAQATAAVTAQGLSGDRYATGQGHWHTVESCPVTLITVTELERATRRARRLREPATPAPGEHRRNLVVSGLRHSPRTGTLRIGAVRFAITRPRPPCGWLNQVVGYNFARALRQDSGICLQPLETGVIQCGDRVHWETEAPTGGPE
ncbi:MOSC domain-containing protein [Thioalkalivibrio sp. ALJT]|uniref:MOSC domain-containing protein n=1 Tax=Thioalkalivibrio sp. ALJT TaxID=1158146 RepID=UPI0003635A5F|nr:MOSC domain-containing protein [Thioalkalivibrio sp. ALJT]